MSSVKNSEKLLYFTLFVFSVVSAATDVQRECRLAVAKEPLLQSQLMDLDKTLDHLRSSLLWSSLNSSLSISKSSRKRLLRQGLNLVTSVAMGSMLKVTGRTLRVDKTNPNFATWFIIAEERVGRNLKAAGYAVDYIDHLSTADIEQFCDFNAARRLLFEEFRLFNDLSHIGEFDFKPFNKDLMGLKFFARELRLRLKDLLQCGLIDDKGDLASVIDELSTTIIKRVEIEKRRSRLITFINIKCTS